MDAADWNDRYADAVDAGAVWAADPPKLVQESVKALTPGTALDLGCGDGRGTAWLAKEGWDVTGVDFSAAGLLLASQRLPPGHGRVELVEADVLTWTPARRFDLVLVAYLHLPSRHLLPLLQRAASWVAPSGHLLIIGHDLANLQSGGRGPTDPDVLYTTELLAEAGRGLHVLRLEQVHRSPARDPEATIEPSGDAVDTLLFAGTTPTSS